MNIVCKKTEYAANRQGIALLLTLVVLVALSTVLYTISERIATYKNRQQYIIDYQKARYACDSGMKFALSQVKAMSIKIKEREDETGLYDFSDLYHLDQEEYEELRWQIAQIKIAQQQEELQDSAGELEKQNENDKIKETKDIDPEEVMSGIADLLSPMMGSGSNEEGMYIDPNSIIVEGPYGQEWPYVIEPMEFEVGESTVSIIVEDENAKLPITWTMTKDEKLLRQSSEGLVNFCEWMQMPLEDIELLQDQIAEVTEQKTFVLNAKDITTSTTSKTTSSKPTSSSRTSTRGRTTTARRTSTRPATTKKTRSKLAHKTDHARLIHGAIIDLERLGRPLPDTGSRVESALKYMGVWGSEKVNINTAPRHVLEAAFAFGGDYLEIADEIIKRRRVKPFQSIKEFEDEYWRFNDSIEKAKPYLSTLSTYFTIKVTATSGKAKAQAITAVTKNGNTVNNIVTISDF